MPLILKSISLLKISYRERFELRLIKYFPTLFAVKNSDVLVGNDFNIPIINILWQLVAGYRFDKDNKNVQNVAEIFQDGLKIHFIPMLVLKVSLTRGLP